MFRYLNHWLKSLPTENEPFRPDLIRFLGICLWTSIVVSLTALLFVLILKIPNWERLVRDNTLVVLLSLALNILLRRGYVRLVTYGTVIGFTVFAAFSAFTGIGIRGTSYGMLLIIIMVTALFIHRRAAYWMAFLSSLIGLGLIWANQAGWMPNADRPLAEPATWLIQTAYFFLTAVVLDITLRTVDRAFRQAQFELEERKRTEEKIRALNTDLEQRVAERTAQLAASEERYRMIAKISSDYVFSTEVNASGTLTHTWVAGAFEAIMGFSFEEYQARGGWVSVLHPEDIAKDREDMAALSRNEPVTTEVRVITKAGEVRWVRVYGYPVWNQVENCLTGVYGAVQDITARKQAEIALQEAELRYRSLVEQTSVVIYRDSPDREARTLYISPQIENLLGYPLAQWTDGTLHWKTLVHPDDLPKTQTWLETHLQSREPFTSTYRIRASDGQWVWVRDEAVVILDAEGKPWYVQGVLINITEQKLAEEQNQELITRLRSVLQIADTLILSPNLDTFYRQTVELAREKLGLERCALYLFDPSLKYQLGTFGTDDQGQTTDERGIKLLISNSAPEDLLTRGDRFWSVYQSDYRYWDELNQEIHLGEGWIASTLIHSATQPIGVFYNDTAITHSPLDRTQQEIVVLFCSLIGNIIERKRAEEALSNSEKRFRALVEQLPAITYSDAIGTLGRTVYISPQVETILGYTPEEWIEGELQFWLSHIHPEDQERALAEFEACFSQGIPVNSEYRMMTKTGKIVWLQDQAIRLTDDNGQPLLIQGVMVDITRQKQTEEQLAQQASQLTALNQLSQEIVASLDLEQVCASAHRAVEQLMPTEAFIIALLHAEQQEMEDIYLFDQGKRWPKRRTPIAQRGMVLHVIQTKQPFYIPEKAKETSEKMGTVYFGGKEHTQSVLIVPLQLGGKVLGVLSAQHYQPYQYTPNHIQMLKTLANQVAIAIDHARLVESLSLQAIALNAAANAIVITDHNGLIQWVNPAFTTLTGYTAQEILGYTPRFLNSGAHPPEFYQQLWNTILAGEPWHGEIINRRKNGTLYTEEQLITPVRNEQGEIFRFVAIKQDVTERKLSEARLAASEERYRNFIAQSSEGIWRLEFEQGIAVASSEDEQIQQMLQAAIIAECNEALARMYGYAQARELQGKRLRDLLSEPVTDYLRQFIRSGYRLAATESHVQATDGQERYLMNSLVGVVENGRPVRAWGLQRDITAQKEAEARALRRRKLLEKVIELGKTVAQETELQACLRQIHTSIQKGLGFDRVGIFLYENETGLIRGTYGTSRTGEIEDTSWYTQKAADSEAWLTALRHPSGVSFVENYTSKNHIAPSNEMFGVQEHVSLAAWAGEKPIALISADNLITQRPITPEQLEGLQLFAGYAGLAIVNARWNAELGTRVAERTQELEAANQELQAFTYTIAHDLRAPARAMIGFSGLLEEHLSEQIHLDFLSQTYLARVQNGAKRMGQMIDQLLEYTRLGRIRIYKQRIEMQKLVEEVLAKYRPEIVERNIKTILHPLPSCQGEPKLIEQVWHHLLTNALKFTQTRSKPVIEIGTGEIDENPYYFIRDNGIGFEMQYAHKLFGVFQRLHIEDEFEGTGMGLALAGRIIEQHGGRIWAESREDQGATFYFSLGY
ncbi:MAG: hypothetical protein Fur0022_18340 [Anaerolineales bacterium]